MEIVLEVFCLLCAIVCLAHIDSRNKASYNIAMVIGSVAYTMLVAFAEGVLF